MIDKIISNLLEIKDDEIKNYIDEEIFAFLNYGTPVTEKPTYRDLTEKEIERINKHRKNIFYIYEAIDQLQQIEE